MHIIFDLTGVTLDERQCLYGPQDIYLKTWMKVFQEEIIEKNESLITPCTDINKREKMTRCIKALYKLILDRVEFDIVDVRKIADNALHVNETINDLYAKPVGRSAEHKLVYPKTPGQAQLLAALRTKDMVFVSGPAGTGKTFLSVVYAITKLRNEEVKRLIITRPVVEAGENLGFLPGDLKEKVDPYLRPIYDALTFMLGKENMEKYIDRGVIEIAPLAYMRGRTLDDAIIILDEAQNTTSMQMKMFLTRMGFHSQMIITGDETQIDLSKPKQSGLQDAMHRLMDVEEIAFVRLQAADVVRHPLVKKILAQYDKE